MKTGKSAKAACTYPQAERGCPCLLDSGTCRRPVFGHSPARESPSHSPLAAAAVVFAADGGDIGVVFAVEVVAAAATAAEAAAAVVAAAAVAAAAVAAVATLVTAVAAVAAATVAAAGATAFRFLDLVPSPIPCLVLFLIV